jgi:hypothetical protein
MRAMRVRRDECLRTFATRAYVYHRHWARGVVRNVPDPIFKDATLTAMGEEAMSDSKAG